MPPDVTEDELKAFKAAQTERDALKAEVEKLKAPPEKKETPPAKEPVEGDEELRGKAKREREESEKKNASAKALENALKFNLGLTEFAKSNADILPKEFSDILKAAERETFDSAADKAAAIKSSLVQEFFSVQANLDLLTASQKATFQDFLKLTKTAKEQKSAEVFENIFEPAFESLKRVRKAEELAKANLGIGSGNKVEDDYKNRLVTNSRKAYLGEKGDK